LPAWVAWVASGSIKEAGGRTSGAWGVCVVGAVRGVGAVAEVVAVGSEEIKVSVLSWVAWHPSFFTAAAVFIAPATIKVAPASVLLGVVATSVPIWADTGGVVIADAASTAAAPSGLSLVDYGAGVVPLETSGEVRPGHVGLGHV